MTAEPGRQLTDMEIQIVSAFMDLPIQGGESLQRQLPQLRVVDTCRCGCPTISFTAGSNRVELIAEAEVADTPADAILLFASNGSLASMEYVWFGDVPPTSWPPRRSLRKLRVR